MKIQQALAEAKGDQRIVTIGTMNGGVFTGKVTDIAAGNDGFVTLTMDTGPAKNVHIRWDAVVSVTQDV